MAAFAFAAVAGGSPAGLAQPYHPDSFAFVLAPTNGSDDPVDVANRLCRRLENMTLRHYAVAVADAGRIVALVPGAMVDVVDPDPLTVRGTLSLHAVLDQAPTADMLAPEAGSLILPTDRADDPRAYRVALDPIVSRTDLLQSEVTLDAGRPAITLRFGDDGARRFAVHTGDHVGEAVAVVLDGNVVTAPVIRQQIAGGVVRISGSFDVAQATHWSAILNAPPLEAPLRREEFLTLDGFKAAVEAGEIRIAVEDACVAE